MNKDLAVKRISGYTIHEAIVVLAIGGLIIFLSTLFYESFLQSYYKRLDSLDENNELISILSKLNEDFMKCEGIKKIDQEITCYFRQDSIQYLFGDVLVIKDSEHFDTLEISCTEIQLKKIDYLSNIGISSLILDVTFILKSNQNINIKLGRNLPVVYSLEID